MEDEKADPMVQAQMAELDISIRDKIGDSIPDDAVNPDLAMLLPNITDDVFLPEDDDKYDPVDPKSVMPEADDYTPESYNEYLTAEVLLPNMGTLTKAKVVSRKRDVDGNPVGRRHHNPILDTHEYEVEFPDGAVDKQNNSMIRSL
jgi:hypothetical protein